MVDDTRSVIAAAHLAPVFLDKTATTAKVIDAIAEAARAGAGLVAFPESYLPGFPVWAALRAPIYNHALFTRFVEASVRVDGEEIQAVRAAARRHEVTVSLGFSERSPFSVGSIWNSNLMIDREGNIVNHHRKLVPTFYEKLIWTPGDGHGLTVTTTPVGRVGALICGENTNPLARYTLMAQAEEIHLSSYPPVWPTRDPAGGGKPYNLESAIRLRAGAHSFEAKVFNLVVSSVLDDHAKHVLRELGETPQRVLEGATQGVSLVTGPHGHVVSDVYRDDEGLLLTEVDVADCIEPKQFHDISGYYNRFDVFDLTVNRRRIAPITFDDMRSTGRSAAETRLNAEED